MKKILIFGGTGFIGLNLVKFLLASKGSYSITVTSRDPISVSRTRLLQFLRTSKLPSHVSVAKANITQRPQVQSLIKNKDVIINLAGYSGAVESSNHAHVAIEINTIGHLNILEVMRKSNKKAILILASSRLEYGTPEKLPVKPDHPLKPKTVYGISKYTATKYSQMYHKLYNLKTITFRISNPYGPQLPPTSTSYNLINHFIHLAQKNETVRIFGKGTQKRDYIYIDDLCQAFVAAFSGKVRYGQVINIGSGRAVELISMARLIVKKIGKGKIKSVQWPNEWKHIETGDFFFDTKNALTQLGWRAKINPENGITKTNTFIFHS